MSTSIISQWIFLNLVFHFKRLLLFFSECLSFGKKKHIRVLMYTCRLFCQWIDESDFKNMFQLPHLFKNRTFKQIDRVVNAQTDLVCNQMSENRKQGWSLFSKWKSDDEMFYFHSTQRQSVCLHGGRKKFENTVLNVQRLKFRGVGHVLIEQSL